MAILEQPKEAPFYGLSSATLSLVVLLWGLLGLGVTGCDSDEAIFKPAVVKLAEEAHQLSQSGQLDTAIGRLEAAASLTPNASQIQYDLGVLYHQKGWPLKAIEAYSAAIKANPDQTSDVWYNKAVEEQLLGDALLGHARALANPQSHNTEDDPQAAFKKTVASMQLPQELVGLSPNQLKDQALIHYQAAVESYSHFLKVAASPDKGRADAQLQLETLRSKIGLWQQKNIES